MSEKNYEFEMIYKSNIANHTSSNNILYNIIYKPNENKKEKKEKIKNFKMEYNFILDDVKEYSEDILRLFGKKFVKKNKNKCRIIYENKKYRLKEYLEEIDNNYKNKNIIKLKLYEINNISDMSYMFYGCYHLFSVSEYQKWSFEDNLNNTKVIFSEDDLFLSLYEEKKMDNYNKKDIENYFSLSNNSIKELKSISSIKRNTNINSNTLEEYKEIQNGIPIFSLGYNRVSNMSYMLTGCISLISPSFISKLDISNVKNINSVFSGCQSLKELSDISNWNTSNVITMRALFNDCNSLKSLPDISKWDLSNVINMEGLFQHCSSLKTFPDITIWNTKNVRNIGNLFNGCNSLISLPDISKWDTSNVIYMRAVFRQCTSLIFLPDISKWDTSKVINIEGIFEFCNSLIGILLMLRIL